MEQKNYFIAVDKNGHILNDFKMKCNYIEIKDNGIYFYEKKTSYGSFDYRILAFYTYDLTSGYETLTID